MHPFQVYGSMNFGKYMHLPMQETQVRSLGWEDPLEKDKYYPIEFTGIFQCLIFSDRL